MMQKSKSCVWMRSKVLYIIPMATLALSVFATSESLFPSGNVLPIAQEYPSKEKLVPVDESDSSYFNQEDGYEGYATSEA